MTNTSTVGGAPPPPNPNTFTMFVGASNIPPGSPVTSKLVDDINCAVIAAARVSSLAFPLGITSSAGSSEGKTRIQYAGPLTLTAEEWAATVDNADGTHVLIPNFDYYLSEDDGRITSDVPTTPGAFLVYVGRAISPTTLMIRIGDTAEIT